MMRNRKEVQESAVRICFQSFAFTYRFSFTEERAGETRADMASS